MIRMLIADDHIIVRNGLKHLFGLAGGVVVAGEAENGAEVLEILLRHEFDLLLLDLVMPGISGSSLISLIREKFNQLPILVLSMHNESQVAQRALKAGANGFVTKGSEQSTLIEAVHTVAKGGHFLDASIVEKMMFEKPALHEQLSERERLVFKRLAQGKGVNEIALELFISNKTVSTHKARLMQKMNFQSNAELVRYAAKQGLIE